MANRTQVGNCVYCGNKGRLTEDHIPPKSLFPESARKRLLKIPSCESCNNGASKDDEYFRTMIALNRESKPTTSLDEIRAAAVRSMKRPQAAKFRDSITRTMKETFVANSAGVFVPAVAGEADLTRFDRVISRTIRGIFFTEQKTPLSPSYRVINYSMAGFNRVPSDVGGTLIALIESLTAQAPKLIGGPEFVFWSYYDPKDVNQSRWLIFIHGRHTFIGWTVKRYPD